MAGNRYIKGVKDYDSFENTKGNTKMTEQLKVADILKYPIADLTHRKITKATCEHFNIRMAVSEKDGKTPEQIFFPSYDQKDKLTGWKVKDLTLDKDDKYYITVIGKVKITNKLFGQREAERIQRKKNRLILVEGEEDLLISYQALAEWADSTDKFKGLRPFVVGLSLGAGNAVEAVHNNHKFVSSFEKIGLAFDNDFATETEKKKGIVRGKEATDNVASSILSSNVEVLDYSGIEQKDPNDIYLELGSKSLANLLSFKWETFKAEKVVTAQDIGFETFIRKREEGIYIPSFPKLMEKLHGFRKRELVVVTSPSGVGKSSVTSEIAYHLADQGQRVGMIFLEEETDETLQRMGARYLQKNYNHFKKDPQKFASMEQLQESFDWCKDEERFVFLDHFGSMAIEEFINKINNFVHINKVDYIILDHLSMLTSGGNASETNAALEKTMVELAAYVASHDVGIIAVSHLNRSVASEFKAPKGQEDKPFWVNVRKEDLKGASGLEQLSWIVLGLEPEQMPDKSRGRVRWTVLKNRPWSYLGIADTFSMDDTTGLMVSREDEY